MNFSVLVVCTGNLCRSPAAELLLRERVAGLPITVSSAGTSGLSGHDMDAATAFVAREFDLDPSHHVARRLTPVMVAQADLVLTAESEHRSIIIQGEPLAFRRVFTMREFARLGAVLPPLDGAVTLSALRARVAAVAEQRGSVEPAAPGSDDIGDPLGASIDVARSTFATIADAMTDVVHALGISAPAEPRAG